MLAKRIAIYLLGSFGFSWLLWAPLFVNEVWGTDLTIFPGQAYFAFLGPFIGVIVTFLWLEQWDELRRWLLRTFSLRFAPKWIIVVLVLLFFYTLIALPIHAIVAREWPDFSPIGLSDQLPDWRPGTTFIFWMILLGLGGEAGWRGFLLSDLYKKFSFSRSAALTALLWMLWHLPLFGFGIGYKDMGIGVVWWFITMFYISILLAWLCRGSGWSILPVTIWIGGYTVLTANEQSDVAMAVVCNILVIMHGFLISRKLVRERQRSLRPNTRR